MNILQFLSGGLTGAAVWQVVAYTLVVTHITITSVTIFLHRHQTHRALELNPAASHFFRFWLWLTTGMKTREWVAVHRKHHATCETPEDPHSPKNVGIWYFLKLMWPPTLLGSVALYKKEAAKTETLEKFGKGTPNDWIEKNIYTPHASKGVLMMLAIDVLLFGLPGIAVWIVQMYWIPLFAAGVINGIGHWWGYRNFATPDKSRNITPFGMIIGGEELHNNHHGFPGSAKFSARWWEVDIGWGWITLLRILGLAWVTKRVIPPWDKIAQARKSA